MHLEGGGWIKTPRKVHFYVDEIEKIGQLLNTMEMPQVLVHHGKEVNIILAEEEPRDLSIVWPKGEAHQSYVTSMVDRMRVKYRLFWFLHAIWGIHDEAIIPLGLFAKVELVNLLDVSLGEGVSMSNLGQIDRLQGLQCGHPLILCICVEVIQHTGMVNHSEEELFHDSSDGGECGTISMGLEVDAPHATHDWPEVPRVVIHSVECLVWGCQPFSNCCNFPGTHHTIKVS
ncbi:unnamed protein product [Notodromas monacha]|uniref:Uncharacterized protein n=1 Tax=Notodromas monacha TaxID=399045 RepID=A0A7R9BD78_9CRUS|nr:unnamed protein product [Notodromas monacha]CAG0912503.1 unnamed protein product [Notodromas monacha]